MSEWTQGVAWSSDLETGNEVIDSQHRQIFKLTSDLIEAFENNKGNEVIDKTLNFLASYTVRHFTDEEALQLEHEFPDYENHKRAHEDFKEKIEEMTRQYRQDSASLDFGSRVNSIIVRWLLKHIKREDSKIAEHIRAAADGK